MATKTTRTAKQLQQTLLERIEAIPDLRGQMTGIHHGGVIGIDPGDAGGANWTVRSVSDVSGYRSDIARIVRELQMRFDLED